MITPELARTQSNENVWKKISIHCKKGIQWGIDNGLAQVRINYNNKNYGYFYKDIKILKNIGFSLEILDEAKSADIDTIKDARSYIIIHW